MRQGRGALTAKTSGDPGSSDALDPGSCIRNIHHFRISAQCNIYQESSPDFSLYEELRKELLTDRIHRKYNGMRDPCDSEGSVRKKMRFPAAAGMGAPVYSSAGRRRRGLRSARQRHRNTPHRWCWAAELVLEAA